MDNALPTIGTGSEAGSVAQARSIRAANMALIESCDAIVANMVPFRGPSMDLGTAYEMGVGAAWGKIVVGYGAGGKGYVGKVMEWAERRRDEVVRREKDGILRDQEGWAVEEFGIGEKQDAGVAVDGGGLVDNLMAACGVERLCETVEEAIKEAVQLYNSRESSGQAGVGDPERT